MMFELENNLPKSDIQFTIIPKCKNKSSKLRGRNGVTAIHSEFLGIDLIIYKEIPIQEILKQFKKVIEP